MNEARLEEMFGVMAERYGPPTKIVMTRQTFLAIRKAFSRFHTRQNRKRVMRRRRAIGRGRW